MEKININVDNGTKELVIRQGEAPKVYDPVAIKINGTIKAPYLWLEKRLQTFSHLDAHVLVDRDKMTITLVINEENHFRSIITGKLELHPVFVKFGINAGIKRSTLELGEFIKMNRAFFEDRMHAMNLVTELKSFKAKVNKEVENAQKQNGDRRFLLDQVVNSNIPESFKLNMPIFKGEPKDIFEVEVYIDPDDFSCTLVSPRANELMEDNRDLKIDEVLEAIRQKSDDIVIIEQ